MYPCLSKNIFSVAVFIRKEVSKKNQQNYSYFQKSYLKNVFFCSVEVTQLNFTTTALKTIRYLSNFYFRFLLQYAQPFYS